jgi:malate dehydrogenase (oxaloacetate-decarboxylating)(NADP+)
MHPKIIAASEEIVSDGLAKPILLAKNKQELLDRFEELNHNPDGIQIIEQKHWPHRDKYIDEYYNLRQRKGMTIGRSYMDMKNHFNFGTMMLRCGHADAMLAGISVSYPQVLKPALKLIRKRELNSVVAGLYLTWHNSKLIAMADCTVNINPTAEELAEITLLSANELIRLHVNPIIAMVSFTNFSAVRCPETEKVARAVEIVKSRRPDLMIDGPVQADIAFDQDHLSKYYPFANIHQRPNLIVFPSLDAGNIALRMLKQFSNIHMIGPLLLGMSKPIHLLPRECDVSNIMSMAAIATVDAQSVITS